MERLSRSGSAALRLTVAVALAGASAAPAVGEGANVRIADSSSTATRLAAEAAAQALAAQGYTVSRSSYSTAAAAEAATRLGGVDVSMTETATLLERVLARPKERDDARLRSTLATLLAARSQALQAVAPYDDAPQVACTGAAVRAHRLGGLLALGADAPKLTYAVNPAHVVRADGLAALRVKFRRVIVSPDTLRFDVIAHRRAHCVLSSAAEPRSARLALVALRDATRRLAGTPQHGIAVVSQAYRASAPASFAPTLDRVAALLTTQNMRTLLGAVDLDGQDVTVAAQGLLRANGVIP
jgi:glycine betaine/choline ABC-type transport system substrate-binding protein